MFWCEHMTIQNVHPIKTYTKLQSFMGSLPDDFKNSHGAAILPVIKRRKKKKSAILFKHQEHLHPVSQENNC
jgi:hypothetical protein